MITIIRQNQRWLLLIVAVVTIIAFGWLYTADPSEIGANRVAVMYGKTIYTVDVDRDLKSYQLALALGLVPLVSDLTMTASSEEDALSEFLWNLYAVRHEADRLWLRPTTVQIADTIRSLPAFQGPQGFDRVKFTDFLQTQLAPRGLTELHLENMVRDFLVLSQLRELVTSPVMVTQAELDEAFRGFQPVDFQVAKWNREESGAESTTPTEEEISEYFSAHRSDFTSPEERVVTVAAFTLNEEQSALEGRELVAAMQKLADRVTEFHDQVEENGPGDFSSSAKNAGAVVSQTAPLQQGERGTLPEDAVAAIFRLSEDSPVTPILQDGSRFLVLKLDSITPSRPLELEAVKPQIITLLKASSLEEDFQNKALEAESALRAALAENVSLEEAAEKTGWKVQTFENTVPFASRFDDTATFTAATMGLSEGEVSSMERAPWGVFVAKLNRRLPADEETVRTQTEAARDSLRQNKAGMLFVEWLRAARERADLRIVARPS